MQAARIHEHGGPSVLRIEDVPAPEPGAGEVLVRVLGVSVNHLDLFVREGMPGVVVEFPRVLGCDGTGVIEAVGEGVTGRREGERVVLEPGYTRAEHPELGDDADHLAPDYEIRGEHSDGYGRELVAIDARYVFPLPENVHPVEGAAVPLVFLTAWGMLMTRAKLRPGETVLVIGGASGVGSAAIQIARDLGARVIATAGAEEKLDLALELGAEQAVDHRDEEWPRQVRDLTDGRGVDVVVEHVGPATWSGSMRALARAGRLVTCGATTGPKVEVLLPHLFIKNQSVLGSTMGPRSSLPAIFDKVASGAYRPVLHRSMPLSEVRRAHELLEAREVVGKVVLVPGA